MRMRGWGWGGGGVMPMGATRGRHWWGPVEFEGLAVESRFTPLPRGWNKSITEADDDHFIFHTVQLHSICTRSAPAAPFNGFNWRAPSSNYYWFRLVAQSCFRAVSEQFWITLSYQIHSGAVPEQFQSSSRAVLHQCCIWKSNNN